MLSQPRPVANSNASTTLDRQTDAVDLKKAALPAVVDRRQLLGSLAGLLVCYAASSAVSAQAAEAPVKAPLTDYLINGMPLSPRFYGLQGQEIKPMPYKGELCEGGALNVITTAVNNIRSTYPEGKLPPGTICTLYIYTGTNTRPAATLVLPNVPGGVSRDTMREFLSSPEGSAAISTLARVRVDIPFINGRPGNVEFTDPKVRKVIIGVELPLEIPPAK